ncbi:hypothetical protein D3C87_900420 [compost metagenome]
MNIVYPSYVIVNLTQKVSLKEIEDNLHFPWDKLEFLQRKDATEDIAIKLKCKNISDRFHKKENPDLRYILHNPCYTFDEKLILLKDHHLFYTFLCEYGTLEQIVKYKDYGCRIDYISALTMRNDLTLEFWDKISNACKVTHYLINHFIYDDLMYHICNVKFSDANLFYKYITIEVLVTHRDIKLKDLKLIDGYPEICKSNIYVMNDLARNLSYDDIMEFGLEHFRKETLELNKDINRLYPYFNVGYKPTCLDYMNLHTLKTYKLFDHDKLHTNYVLPLNCRRKSDVNYLHVRSANIQDIRLNCDNLAIDNIIVYNKDVTFRDYELCTNKFYGILKRNVLPLDINTNMYNDIDIFTI